MNRDPLATAPGAPGLRGDGSAAAPGRPAALRTRLRRPLDLVSRGITGQLVALAIVLAIFGIGTGGVSLSPRNLLVVLDLAGPPMIVCLGIHLVIVIGAMDLSVEGVMSFVAVTCGLLVRNAFNQNDIGLWVVPVAVLLGAAAGLAGGLLTTRARIPSFIATLGLWWVTQGLSVIIGKGNAVPMLDTRFQAIASGRTWHVPNSILMAGGLLVVLWTLQQRTRFGRHMYAIGGDEALAQQAGVRVDRVKVLVFALTGAIYGFAALLVSAQLATTNPRIGNGRLFPAMTAVAVGGVSLSGGVGGALNAVLGTLIVVALANGMVLMGLSPYVQTAVTGVVLILAVALTIDRRKIGVIK